MNSASCAAITFPLIRPAILAAGTLNFVRAVESFDTPAIIALPARIEVFTTKIWREALGSFPTNHNLAAAYGVGILGIALIFVYLYRRFTSQVENFSTVTGKGFRPHQIELGSVALRRLRRGVVAAHFAGRVADPGSAAWSRSCLTITCRPGKPGRI